MRAMPIIKAAVKHLRQSEKRRKVNRYAKDNLKQTLKDALKLAKGKQLDELEKNLSKIFSVIDKAAKNNLLHKNNAARKKARLARIVKGK